MRLLLRRSVPSSTSRSLSTVPKKDPQPFVKARIHPGEWDPARTNPLYRPQWKNKVPLISKEDFDKRPTVGFDGDFASMAEGMAPLSWLDQRQAQEIYKLYQDLLQHSHTNHGPTTSHEYVIQVIAQKFNITAQKAAAVIELQHNEEQLVKQGVELEYELADFVDAEIKSNIKDAYEAEGLTPPKDFIEDPVGVMGYKDRKQYVAVGDTVDVDALEKAAALRDEQLARDWIDTHVYVEDVPEETILRPLSKDCKQLLQAHSQYKAAQPDDSVVDYPENAQGRRERWTYVAHILNTREKQKRGRRRRRSSSIAQETSQTLVEHQGTLRQANLADVRKTAWKPLRNDLEHTFKNVKKGWMDKVFANDADAWGPAPDRPERTFDPKALLASRKEAASKKEEEEKVDEVTDEEEDVVDEEEEDDDKDDDRT